MSEDLVKQVTIKRSSKKKSGYTVREEDGEYFIEDVPSKPRVNPGDKVVGINGVRVDAFVDEDNANDLIESIRIVAIPEDDIDEYEAAMGKAAPRSALSSVAANRNTFHCIHCGYNNEDLSEDEDGDLVCENCGHVLEEEDPNARKKREYPCPDCGYVTINPEPDDEGDRICKECACILPEKIIAECVKCGTENVDPTTNKKGWYICESCGEKLPLEKKKSRAEMLKEMGDAANGGNAGGQILGSDGKPITNAEGKTLTPYHMFRPGDVITVTVGKSNPRQEAGLKVEGRNGKYYVRKVPSSGLFAKTPVIPGDKVLEVNGIEHHKFRTVNDLKKIIKDEMRISIVVLRRDPDDSESSASTVDYDALEPVTAHGRAGQEIVERDDDTVGYDGHDCGCVWCPHCHPQAAQ